MKTRYTEKLYGTVVAKGLVDNGIDVYWRILIDRGEGENVSISLGRTVNKFRITRDGRVLILTEEK